MVQTDQGKFVDISKPSVQEGFAELVGVSQQTVSDLCRRKVLEQGQSLGKWLKQYCGHLREQAAGRATKGGLDLATERAKLAKEQRLRIEMQNAITRREFGPIIALEHGLSDIFSRVGSQLDTIPGKLKIKSDVLTADDLDLVSSVITGVRNDIADMTVDWFDDIGDEVEEATKEPLD